MWVGYDPTENFELPGRKLKSEIFGEIDVGGREVILVGRIDILGVEGEEAAIELGRPLTATVAA